jgi:glycogen debranching enzyme
MYQSKKKLKQRIKGLQELLDVQSTILGAALNVAKDLAKEVEKNEELEKNMDKFDKSLKHNMKHYPERTNVYYDKKPSLQKSKYRAKGFYHVDKDKGDDVVIETRWL